MNNIITYADTEFCTFHEFPFNEVDSLILSWLSYINWPLDSEDSGSMQKYPITKMFQAEHFGTMFEKILDKPNTKLLLTSVVASPRFRDIQLQHYEMNTDPAHEEQFAAVTFNIDENLSYVAFRGTDSTFVGWKEDLNMAFQCPVPAQESAKKYLAKVCASTDSKIIVGGHSKGGNLAVYAAAYNAPYEEQILKIYSHDGPGFLREVIESEAFRSIQKKVDKTVPQSSVVGMLLEQHGEYSVVESTGKGFWQHNPFTWCVENGSLHHLPSLTKEAEFMDQTVSAWLATISKEERERFVDGVYMLASDLEADNFLDFGQELQTNIPKVMNTFSDFDRDTQKFMLSTVGKLARMTWKKIPDSISGYLESMEKEQE